MDFNPTLFLSDFPEDSPVSVCNYESVIRSLHDWICKPVLSAILAFSRPSLFPLTLYLSYYYHDLPGTSRVCRQTDFTDSVVDRDVFSPRLSSLRAFSLASLQRILPCTDGC